MNANVIIRPFQTTDLNDVSLIDKESFGEISYPSFFLRQAYDVFGDLFCVAEKDEQVIGYSMGAISTCQEGWLLALAVEKHYRKIGAAKKLTLNLLTLFKEKGVTVVKLTVSPSNLAAAALYKKLGFKVTERVDNYFGPGETRMVLSKKLR